MNFPILDLRSPAHGHDALFPVVAPPEAGRTLVLHADDLDVAEYRARDITVKTQLDGHVQELLTVRRRDVAVTVTDARVTLACEPVTPHGILAGHVKLPWLVAVGGSSRHGRFDNDELRLIVQRELGDYAVLDIGFSDGTDVAEVAADIARRAARLWLETHPGSTSETTGSWREVAHAQRAEAPRGEFHLHWMPEHVPVAGMSRVAAS